ncbi:MAG TPA: GNAT family N-acetyltransferase [Actinomycetota bacterium]|nr:GNAT family N-acetyltransferase [Actinomycetota bacterium]
MDDGLEVRAVMAAQIRPLRQLVLRPGRPPEDSVYPGDDAPATVHLGAFSNGRIVGISSLYREDRAGGDATTPGWRLRGMASAPDFRGRGIGQALLRASVERVARLGGGELWCNARTPAAGFYAKQGFEVVSEPFDIPGVGPHVVMRRWVDGSG